MSDALYERYKEALRRGHVAAQRGRDAAALEAYSEAARLAPDRALPLVGLGGVLRRLGKPAEALATYGAALDRAPTDEAALRGRAELSIETGDRLDAAEAYDTLATVLDGADRLPEASESARHALEAAESRLRRSTVQRYADRLEAAGDDPAVVDELARAMTVLDARVSADAVPEVPPSRRSTRSPRSMTSRTPSRRATPRRPARSPSRSRLATAARTGPSTAIDACYLALAVAPADPGLHLTLADIYLDRGWRPLAIDKLDRLAHLAALTDDEATRDRVCAMVRERLADEPRLAARCA